MVALTALAVAGTSLMAGNHGHHGKHHGKKMHDKKMHGHHHGEGHMHKSYKGKIYATVETDVAGIFRGRTAETELPAAAGGDREDKVSFTPNLAVSLGYFVTEQLAVRGGLELSFGKVEREYETEVPLVGAVNSEQETSRIGFALGVNYSFMKHVCSSPYIEAAFVYAIDETKDVRQSNLFGGQASLGYRMPIGKRLSWSPSFDYRYLSGDTEDDALGMEVDTTVNQWTVNLVKFDYFF
jgi:hypothetical protein